MSLPPASPRRALHARSIHCEGFVRDDGLWDIEARILDTKTYVYTEPYRGRRDPGSEVHDMRVRLTIDDTLTVRDIAVAMPATPYPTCPEAAARFRQLIGLSIGSGWRSEINKRLGGTGGCTHVRELLFPMATVAFQTVRGWPEDNPPEGAPGVRNTVGSDGSRPMFIDGCYAWAADGEVVARLYPAHSTRSAGVSDQS